MILSKPEGKVSFLLKSRFQTRNSPESPGITGFLNARSYTMKQLSRQLLSVIDAAEKKLRKTNAADTTKPVLAGGWSRKQAIGHLIDSASNNHQRFVRAVLQGSLDFPGYDQDGCVRVQAPQEADWELLVSLWAAYNRYLAHVIAHLPESKLGTACRIGSGEAVTLEFVHRLCEAFASSSWADWGGRSGACRRLGRRDNI